MQTFLRIGRTHSIYFSLLLTLTLWWMGVFLHYEDIRRSYEQIVALQAVEHGDSLEGFIRHQKGLLDSTAALAGVQTPGGDLDARTFNRFVASIVENYPELTGLHLNLGGDRDYFYGTGRLTNLSDFAPSHAGTDGLGIRLTVDPLAHGAELIMWQWLPALGPDAWVAVTLNFQRFLQLADIEQITDYVQEIALFDSSGKLLYGSDFHNLPGMMSARIDLPDGNHWTLQVMPLAGQLQAQSSIRDFLVMLVLVILVLASAMLVYILLQKQVRLEKTVKLHNSALIEEIDERIQAEQRLADSEGRFRVLIEAMEDIVFTLDTDSRHTGVYGRWLSAIGLTEADFLGKTASEIMGPEAGKLHADATNTALTGRSVVYEWSVPASTQIIHYQTRLSPVYDESGQMTGLIGVGRDITHLKETERALERLSRLYHVLSSSSQALVHAADEAHLIRIVCDILVSIGGFSVAWMAKVGPAVNGSQPVSIEAWTGGDHPPLPVVLHAYQCGTTGKPCALRRILQANSAHIEVDFPAPPCINTVLRPYVADYLVACVLPVKYQDRMIGIMSVYADIAMEPTALALLNELANELGYGIGMLRERAVQQRMAEQLEESEARYRAMFEQHSANMLLIDTETGEIVDANAAACRYYGYPRVEFQKMNINQVNMLPSETVEALRHQAAVGSDNYFIFKHRLSSGEIRDTEVRTGIINVDGRRTIYSIIHDISARIHAETALRNSHDLLQKILGSLNEAVLVVNPHTRLIVECNPYAEAMFGCSRSDLIGHETMHLHVDMAHFEQFGAASLPTYLAQGYYATEWRMRRRSGEIFDTEHYVVPLYDADGELQNVVSVVRDISERKRADNALRHSEAQMRATVENMPVVMVAFDAQGHLIVWNKEGERLTGYTAEEIDRDVTLRAAIYPHMPEDSQAVIRGVERTIICQDGAVRVISWFDISADYPIPGWASWMIGINVTERVRAQNEILSANEDLERRVALRTRALMQAEAAERKQRIFSESLREIATVLNSTLDLEVVLDHIMSSLSHLLVHDALSIVLMQGKNGIRMVRARGYGDRVGDLDAYNDYLSLDNSPHLRQMLATRRPLLIPDTGQFPGWPADALKSWIRGYAGAPIIVDEDVIGFINAISVQPSTFGVEDLERLKAFTEQAAIAVRNARLYEQAGHLAAIEERQRLARDLHDAVTQTMFSANVVSQTLRRLWDKDREKVKPGLDQIHQLTRGALAEMRTLLLELRPEALEERDLDKLLVQLGDAFSSRTGAAIEMEILPVPDLPLPVKTVMYRVTQEALNNISRHTRASQVKVKLTTSEDGVTLDIEDNGRGFCMEQVVGDHFGLKIMQERAEAINALLHIHSAIHQGTHIQLHWPCMQPVSM